MMQFLFGRRLNHVDLLTILFGYHALNENAGWLIFISIMIAGISLSYFGEQHLKGKS